MSSKYLTLNVQKLQNFSHIKSILNHFYGNISWFLVYKGGGTDFFPPVYIVLAAVPLARFLCPAHSRFMRHLARLV